MYITSILGNFEVAKLLLNLGADPNVQNRLGEAPLHQAAEKNNAEFTKLLLSYKANANIQQNDGDTPLHLACNKGHYEIVKILLSEGANPDIPNSVLGRTALHIACEKNHCLIVGLLVQNQAKVLIEDKNSIKPYELTTDIRILSLLSGCENSKFSKINEEATIGIDEALNSKDSTHEPESEKGIPSGRLCCTGHSFSFGEGSKSALYT